MTRLATALLAALVAGGTAAALAVPEPATGLRGHAVAVDGDTLRVGAARVRLFGVDAPEAAQTCHRAVRASTGLSGLSWRCGAHATAVMQAMLARDPVVTCEPKDTDRHGRMVAVCSNSEGDLGARMVAQGLAVAYRRYSSAYADHEDAARAEKLGMWSGRFTMPEDWRRAHK